MNYSSVFLTHLSALSLVLLCAPAQASAAGTGRLRLKSRAKAPVTTVQKTQISVQAPATMQPLAPKPTFWDLAVDHFIINGVNIVFPNDFYQAKVINVKVGEPVNCQCYYKVRTLAVGEITSGDANYWGTGALSYKITGGLFYSGPPSNQEYKNATRMLPKFTYADAQAWKTSLGAAAKKEWSESMVYNWTPTAEQVGKALYLHFDVDTFMSIKETDEQNNGSFSSSGVVAKFIVTSKVLIPSKAPVVVPNP